MVETNTQEKVCQSPNYKPVHKHGFVGLVDIMGDDSAIVQAARVSYGAGTKKVNEDRGLIRYLLRHKHTTPLEMVELKFHIKMPIFVMRQHIRHRMANVNEYSGRYSKMSDEFYVPELDYIQEQSTTNKQGSEDRGGLSTFEKKAIQFSINETYKQTYHVYEQLLGTEEEPGISRESARFVLPVGNYTECYWKIDLHNLMHFLKLRADSHAQREIQDYALAMIALLEETGKLPFAMEAFEDYVRGAVTFSKKEMFMIQSFLKNYGVKLDDTPDDKISKRELGEFAAKLGLTISK